MDSTPRLHEDSSGVLWLLSDPPGAGPDEWTRLGPPGESLFHLVPPALWGELATLIADREDADRFEDEYRREIDETYRRQQL